MQYFSFCKVYRKICWYLWISTGISFNIFVFYCKINSRFISELGNILEFPSLIWYQSSPFLPFCVREWAGPGHCRASLGSRTDLPVNALCPALAHDKNLNTPEYSLLHLHTCFSLLKQKRKKPTQPTLNKKPKHTDKHSDKQKGCK